MRSHDGRHATGTTDFELYISMFVPQSCGCFPLCLSLHGTCRALAQMYILVTHMIALQLPFHLTTVGPLAPYKSCVSHPCIARACTDCDPTIWYFVFILFHTTETSLDRTNGAGERLPQRRTARKQWQPNAFTNFTDVPRNPRELTDELMTGNRRKCISKFPIQRYGKTPGSSECLGASSRHTTTCRERFEQPINPNATDVTP